MRKVAILVVLIVTLGMGTAFAEFSKEVDSFNGSTTLICAYDISSHFDSFLSRVIDADKSEATFLFLYTMTSHYDGWYFFSGVAEMKVDDNPFYQLKVTDTSSRIDENRFLRTKGMIVLEPEIVETVKKASKITVRYYFKNQQPLTFTLPDKILQEWKQVLNYQK